MATGGTLYQVLQVDPAAEQEIIEAAYRRLAKMYHPDVAGTRDAEARMKAINAAYEVLRDRGRRAAYNQNLAFATSTAPGTSHPGSPRADEDEEAWVACLEHPDLDAAGNCAGCGAALCENCLYRFQPPACASCVLAWTAHQRKDFGPRTWFYEVLFILGPLALIAAPMFELYVGRTFDPHLLGYVALSTYVLACLPAAWRVFLPVPGIGWRIVTTVLLGPLVGPPYVWLIGIQLRKVRRLEALAMAG
jgi:DnaJ-like protein